MDWQSYYFGMAKQATVKCKDPSTQVGAVLVGADGEIRLTAFNGPAKGVEDRPERFSREGGVKYLYAAHAEANLIAFAARAGIPTKDCTVFCTHAPCAACARTMIQAGIKRIVCEKGFDGLDRERWGKDMEASVIMCQEAGVLLEMPPTMNQETIAGTLDAGKIVATTLHDVPIDIKADTADPRFFDIVEAAMAGVEWSWRPTHRHVKTGGLYRVWGPGIFQGDVVAADMDRIWVAVPREGTKTYRVTAEEPPFQIWDRGRAQCSLPICKGMHLVIYQAHKDLSLWARPESEFADGRFEELKKEA